MYRAIQDIYKNKKPLLTLCSEKGLTTNEEKTTETLIHYFSKMFTRITQQMPEPIPMSGPITWEKIYEASLKLHNNKALTIMDFKQNTLNMHHNVYIKI